VCTSWIEGVHTAKGWRYGCKEAGENSGGRGALARAIRLLRGRGESFCIESGGKEAVLVCGTKAQGIQ